MVISLLLAFIGFGFLAYYKKGNPTNWKKTLLTGIILILQSLLTFLIGFKSADIVKNQARAELIRILKESTCVVYFNGRKLDEEKSNEIIGELIQTRYIQPHHSDTTKNYKIVVQCENEDIELTLEQDKEIPTEYWVFWNKYKTTKSNELGRIRTEKIKTVANNV